MQGLELKFMKFNDIIFTMRYNLKYKDMQHFKTYMESSGMDVQMEYLGEQQLVALQVWR